MQSLPGLDVGRYTLAEKIYEGAEAAVYRACHGESRTPVVIKLLTSEYPELRSIARLRHEHAIMSGLRCEGIVKVYGLEKYRHGLALILEDLGDGSLSSILRSQRMDLQTSLQIAVSVAGTLAAIHQHNIIHKDIKPRNIMIDSATRKPKLIDFGIATHLSRGTQRAMAPDSLEGTLAYISPEQTGRMNRAVDHRTDLYSFGITLYEMLTGTLPFTANDPMELVYSHIARLPVPPCERSPEVPRAVSDIVMRLLAKAAEDRYQSARGLKEDLEECLSRVRANGHVEPFPLGRHDSDGELRLPQKLYGREKDIEALLAAHERTQKGAVELLLVRGHAGVGKSALVNEIHKAIARNGGYFISGKFDQLSRNIPYAPMTRAFEELVRQILTEPEEALARWKQRMKVVVGSNGQLLVDLIPALDHLLGPQPRVEHLGPSESQNRFTLLFQNFVCALTSAEHPLVIFLDDLQWSDPASLKMIHMLLTDPGSAHLLVIGSYRADEVEPAHPLSFALDDLRKAGTKIGEINLVPLTPADVTRFVEDALGPRAQNVEPLAELLFAKTHGTPFFLNQFFTTLYKEESISFDARSASWKWNLKAIEAMPSAENVAELVASQIQKLPESTQNILMLAACIGHSFDLRTLSIISEVPRAKVAAALWEALRRHFILPLDSDCRFFHGTSEQIELLSDEDFNVSYQFFHDRVQQVAYSLLERGREQEVNLRIGRLMLAKSAGSPHDDELFDVVNHLNFGAGLIISPVERSALARLNLAASKRAKAATAYQAAASYLAAGVSLLEETSWDDDHALCYALHVEWAEVEFLTGRFDQAEILFEKLLSRAGSIVQQGRVHALRIVLGCTRGEFSKALEIGRAALALFGMDLPAAADARQAVFAATVAAVEKDLPGLKLEELLTAPEMTDPEKQVAMKLLSTLITPAVVVDASLYPLIIVTMVSISLKYGPSDMSADGYTLYGSVLMGQMGRYREASEFARLGLDLNERFNNHQLKGRLNFMIGTYSHVFAPLHTVIDYFQHAKQLCLESGNFLFAANACCYLFHTKFALGFELAAVRDELDKNIALAERTKAHMGTWFQRLGRQVVANLMGHTEGRLTLSGCGFDEAAFVTRIQGPEYAVVALFYDFFKAELLFLRGDHAGAVAAVARTESRLNVARNLHVATELLFYRCLILAALYPAAAGEQAGHLHTIDEHQARIARFAESCPENFRHKHLLVAAERARITGEELLAMKLFDQAVAAARSSGFVRDEALANELCAQFHRAHGRERIAELYIADAYHAYTLWGATSKATDLEERYPHVIARFASERSQGVTKLPRGSTFTTTGTIQPDFFDLSLVARAAEAISDEAALDKVLERVMRIILESVGAERAVLFWKHDGEMMIEASITLHATTVDVGPPAPMARSTALPLSILHYVERSHEAVVLGDAAYERSRYLADPYIAGTRPKSVMCVPMMHHGHLAGMLYLEHSTVRNVFTAERCEVCGLLASQATIAIENTRLYERINAITEGLRRANESLEAAVARRTEELYEANNRLQLQLVDRVRAEEERAALQAEIIKVQRARLAELSAPLIPIIDRIMVMPLIGVMDAKRAVEAVATALRGAERSQAAFVIVDITGIKAIDADVASTLMRMASALRLIGTNMVLTGISPEVARIMMGLEVDLGCLVTRGDLRTGVAYAMGQLRLDARRSSSGITR